MNALEQYSKTQDIAQLQLGSGNGLKLFNVQYTDRQVQAAVNEIKKRLEREILAKNAAEKIAVEAAEAAAKKAAGSATGRSLISKIIAFLAKKGCAPVGIIFTAWEVYDAVEECKADQESEETLLIHIRILSAYAGTQGKSENNYPGLNAKKFLPAAWEHTEND